MKSGLFGALRKNLGAAVAAGLFLILKEPNSAASAAKVEGLLRGILRRFPYWSGGHLRLAGLQLGRKDQPGAYISARAVMNLRGEDFPPARHLLGRIYLQSGREKEAESLFIELLQGTPHNNAVREDLAAAQMHFQKYDEAKEQLERIPEAERTPEGAATLEYLKRR